MRHLFWKIGPTPLVSAVLMPGVAAFAGETLYVDDDAPGGGDGASWKTAFADLQCALEVAGDPKNGITEIHIAGGLYVPSKLSDPKDPRSATFDVISGVSVIGQYAGLSGKDPDLRDPAYETILSGDLSGNDGPPGTFTNYEENSYHVLSAVGVDESTVLEGLTISGGNACCQGDQFDPLRHGGGLYMVESDLTAIDCTFRHNNAFKGGGASCQSGDPMFIGCSFTKNYAIGTLRITFGEGGAVYAEQASPSFLDCTFTGNATATNGGAIAHRTGALFVDDSTFIGNGATLDWGGDGGAIYSLFSTVEITGSAFSGNQSEEWGGAVFVGDAKSTLADCTFDSNQSLGSQGGAILALSATTAIAGCTFINNEAEFDGGAVGLFPIFDGSVSDCVFAGNTAWDGGGALAFSSGLGSLTLSRSVFLDNYSDSSGGAMENRTADVLIRDCLFAYNDSFSAGGALHNSGGNATLFNTVFLHNETSFFSDGGAVFHSGYPATFTLINCTVWHNHSGHGGGISSSTDALLINSIIRANTPDQASSLTTAVIEVRHCNIEGGWAGKGEGNIDLDPMFVNSANGDLRLLPGSPCIDAGDNAALPDEVETDRDGLYRFRDDPETPDTGVRVCGESIADMGAYEFQPAVVTCPSDVAEPTNGRVDRDDLMAVIEGWSSRGKNASADITGDGVVNVTDLLAVICAWGPCVP